jgi:hypothetical protein
VWITSGHRHTNGDAHSWRRHTTNIPEVFFVHTQWTVSPQVRSAISTIDGDVSTGCPPPVHRLIHPASSVLHRFIHKPWMSISDSACRHPSAVVRSQQNLRTEAHRTRHHTGKHAPLEHAARPRIRVPAEARNGPGGVSENDSTARIPGKMRVYAGGAEAPPLPTHREDQAECALSCIQP